MNGPNNHVVALLSFLTAGMMSTGKSVPAFCNTKIARRNKQHAPIMGRVYWYCTISLADFLGKRKAC